jgi:hypothetical protein
MPPVTRPTRSSELDGAGANGLSPREQMRARDEQSRKDAAVLAAARRQAAMRALGSLGVLSPEPAPARPAAGAAEPTPPDRGAGAASEPPLAETGPSLMSAEAERTGERLAVYADRVELVDRNDRVLQRIATADVREVVVNKRFTGTSVTVEPTAGEPIVARGLKPDQADDIRALLVEGRTPGEAGGAETDAAPGAEAAAPAEDEEPAEGDEAPEPAAATPTGDPGADADDDAEAEPEADAGTGDDPDGDEAVQDVSGAGGAVEVRLDETDLLAKLSSLHEAGVLSDDEYRAKVEVVAQMARRGHLAVTSAQGA